MIELVGGFVIALVVVVVGYIFGYIVGTRHGEAVHHVKHEIGDIMMIGSAYSSGRSDHMYANWLMKENDLSNEEYVQIIAQAFISRYNIDREITGFVDSRGSMISWDGIDRLGFYQDEMKS